MSPGKRLRSLFGLRVGVRSRHTVIIALCAGLIVCTAAQETADGAVYTWIDPAGGGFCAESNWSPAGGPPDDASDTAIFNLANTYTAIAWENLTIHALEVRGGNVTLEMYRDISASPGITFAGILTLDPGPTGTAAVIGTTSVSVAELFLDGIFGANDGDDSEVIALGPLQIGRDAGSNGDLSVDVEWTGSSSTTVGVSGIGTLTITNHNTMSNASGFIGFNSSGNGHVIVSPFATWTNTGTLTIGRAGTGLLNINDGTVQNDGDAVVADLLGSTGVVIADGTWMNNASLFVGGSDPRGGGNGTVSIIGGTTSVASDLGIRFAGTVNILQGTLFVTGQLITSTGGQLNLIGDPDFPTFAVLNVLVGNLNLTPGTFTWTAGKMIFRSGFGIGAGLALGPALTIDAAKVLDVAGIFQIGVFGPGVLTVSGGTVTSGPGRIGSTNPKATGAAVVLNGTTASWEIAGKLDVLGANDALLQVVGGAALTTGDGFVAAGIGTVADVDISDADSLWSSSGSVYLGGNETATGGSGSMDLTAGGTLDVTSGTIKVWNDFQVRMDGGVITSASMDVTGTINSRGSGVNALNLSGASLNVDGGSVELGVGDTVVLTGGMLNVSNGGSVIALISGKAATQVTLQDSGSNWSTNGPLEIATAGSGLGQIGTLTLQTGATLSVAGAVTVLDSNNFTLAGGTLNADSVDLGTNDLSGFGSINGDFSTNESVIATGDLTLGDASSFSGVQIGGALDVGPHTVTLNKNGFFNIGNSTSITGGTLAVPGGVALPVGNNIVAFGAINGRIVAQSGSTIEAGGSLTLGDAAALDGFFSDGVLVINSQTVTIADANEAVLGSLTILGNAAIPGTLLAANGAVVEFGKNVMGFGTVNTPNDPTKPLINNGAIIGNSAGEPIELTGHVKGVGTFDNVSFTGTFSPGFSSAAVFLGSVSYNGTLVIEIGGLTPGSEHDQVNHDGTAGLGGVLQIELINGFEPQVGDIFVIMTFASRTGQFEELIGRGECNRFLFQVEYHENDVTLVATETLPADVDLDGQLDLSDYDAFESCVTGPADSVTSGCSCADVDQSGTVDLRDFGILQDAFTGD